MLSHPKTWAAALVPRALVLLLGLAGLLAVSASTARAATVVVGQTAPPNPPPYCAAQADLVQHSSSGSSYAVPAPGGTVTSWSTMATAGPNQTITLKVLRPLPGGAYSVIATDGPRPLEPSALNSFQVSIPVAAGDLVALNSANAVEAGNACLFAAGAADLWGASVGDTPIGGSFLPQISSGNARLNVAATVELADVPPPPPPSRAPTLAGPVPATAPAAATCVVPKLSGKKLRAARRALRRAGCSVGTVRGLKVGSARVEKQWPRPGTVRGAGAKVSVKAVEPR